MHGNGNYRAQMINLDTSMCSLVTPVADVCIHVNIITGLVT